MRHVQLSEMEGFFSQYILIKFNNTKELFLKVLSSNLCILMIEL